MPTFTATKSYSDGNPLTEEQLDDLKGSIETFLNTTKIDGDNLQTGGVPEAALASNSVVTAKINAGAVTTAKIADSGVTTAKIADANVTLAKMAASSVDTSQLVDAAVTQAKLAERSVGTSVSAGGVALSASSENFSTTSSTFVDVTNLSVTITTTGRPVIISMFGVGDGEDAGWGGSTGNGNSTIVSAYQILRDATVVCRPGYVKKAGSIDEGITVDRNPSMGPFLDDPAAGTYTYKLQVKGVYNDGQSGTSANADLTIRVTNCKLLVYEL